MHSTVHASTMHFAKVPSMKATNDRALPTIAAHRFGLGEADVQSTVGHDARGWLLSQLGPADTALGDGLVSSNEGLRILPPSATSGNACGARTRPAGHPAWSALP
jgi:hypothetical protein